MELTTWQKFCHRILGGFLRKKSRNNTELKLDMEKAHLKLMPEVYVASNVMSTFLSFFIFIGLVALFFIPNIGIIALYEMQQDPLTVDPCIDWEYWNEEKIDFTAPGNGCPHYNTKVFPQILKIVIPIVGLLVLPFSAYKYFNGTAKRIANKRSQNLEKFIPYAASYTAAMSAANATPQKIFRSLAVNGHLYGDIAEDAALIYRDINLLGFDLITALKMSVDRAASPWLTEFLQGMVGTLTSGGNLKMYFLNRAEHYMRENRTRLNVFLETLAMLAESYVVVAVAMPLFLIVMLVIMFWVSGSGSQMSEGMLYAIVLGLLPLIHIAYSSLVWLMSSEQKM